MTPDDGLHLLADPRNGVVTPVYSDRQVVRASDLTLDRESHDAALARMRRLLHGHGIVSGLVPEARETAPDEIRLSPGYAVAPSGAEIFLPEPVLLRDLAARIAAVCGPGGTPCEDVTEAAQRKARAARVAAEDSSVTRGASSTMCRADCGTLVPRPRWPLGAIQKALSGMPASSVKGVVPAVVSSIANLSMPPAVRNCGSLIRRIQSLFGLVALEVSSKTMDCCV